MLQENENILASASGDGSIKIWDLAAPPQSNPLRSFEEHSREVTAPAGNQADKAFEHSLHSNIVPAVCTALVTRKQTAELGRRLKRISQQLEALLDTECYREDKLFMLFQVYSLNWNMTRQNLFLSGSWDDTIKLWDIHRPQSVSTFAEHTYCVYAANW